jgi:DNA-binding NarL/FixJ family response regulator
MASEFCNFSRAPALAGVLSKSLRANPCREHLERQMNDSVFHILFLGDDLTWSTLSEALTSASGASLKIQRVDSLADLFQNLAETRWHAAVLDVRAWNFQGLHFVEKVRAEYPAFPILALYPPSIPQLHAKALTCGASRCLNVENLTASTLDAAVSSCLAEQKSQSHLAKDLQAMLDLSVSDPPSLLSSKNQLITHALNNLLCVISANAEILADHLSSSGPGSHSLTEIKKAALSAAALMRQLK